MQEIRALRNLKELLEDKIKYRLGFGNQHMRVLLEYFQEWVGSSENFPSRLKNLTKDISFYTVSLQHIKST